MAKKKQEAAPTAAASPQTKAARAKLKSFIERIERLMDEIKATNSDIKDVFAEAKADGWDTKVMRECIRRRRMDKSDLEQFEALLDTYQHALGMLPLFAHADESDTETRREADELSNEERESVAEAAQALQDTVNETGAAMTIDVPGMDPVTIAPQT